MNNHKMRLLNTYVNNLSMKETLLNLDSYIKENHRKSYIVAVNVDVITQIEEDNYLKKIIDNADMVLVDGTPLVWLSKLFKIPVKEKISGSDLVPQVCKMSADKGYTLFFIGGRDGVAEQAKVRLENLYPQIKIVGTYAPPFGFDKNQEELEKINCIISEVKPDILIVCFGCPKQEKFIYENIDKYNAKVSICAGATIDFLAGNIKRAPKWMSTYGLEWFYRFTQEPKRLFKRYFVNDMKIFKLAWKYRAKD
ncbi:WecB/TagA/CpsF family glycosyltransferase [Clostridium sp. C2-6-12]|uniref:WecB/TagA/CpsF family glycosyltransferase n=1 Tax=Clostridium sp. C2-6-12 TaxID=2698832 RepID=UPI00136DB527|nr:WecB/TagA/CpsF family glycosyltransferase [Clostridium sp. C2-6-12]